MSLDHYKAINIRHIMISFGDASALAVVTPKSPLLERTLKVQRRILRAQ